VLQARPSHPPWLDRSNFTWRRVKITKILPYRVFSTISSLYPSSVQIFSSAPFSQTPPVYVN
jgi:hypothetical protein